MLQALVFLRHIFTNLWAFFKLHKIIIKTPIYNSFPTKCFSGSFYIYKSEGPKERKDAHALILKALGALVSAPVLGDTQLRLVR